MSEWLEFSKKKSKSCFYLLFQLTFDCHLTQVLVHHQQVVDPKKDECYVSLCK